MSTNPSRLKAALHSITLRLLVVNLLIAAVPIVGIGFARFYEREMLGGLENDMIHQAQVLRQLLLADPLGLRLDQRGPSLRAAARDTRTRIRLLDQKGNLRSDSHRGGPPEGPEPAPPKLMQRYRDVVSSERLGSWEFEERRVEAPALAQRVEVQRALAGKYGAYTRTYKNGERLFLFSALPIQRDGKIQGVIYVTRSTNPVRASLYRLRSTLFKVLIWSLVATAILSLFFAATISRPLTRLTQRALRIADGDRSQALSLARDDEIGALARAFARMTQRLDGRAQEVAELAANISHEFKSPLTAIRGAAELLQEGAVDDANDRQRFIDNILQDAHRLDRLVTRLLELSRLEADPVPDSRVDLRLLLIELCADKPGAAQVALHCQAAQSWVIGKRAHLASALANLIENARQHATPGTVVEVRLQHLDAKNLRISVCNQGPSISPANLTRVWDRFFTTRPDSGGTGLGLAIVASVLRAHGGQFGVESHAESGTCFWILLPALPK